MVNAKKNSTPNSTTGGAAFPLQVACIDMGSNAIRFLAVEFSDENEYTTLAAERRPVRLGHSVFLSGVLDSKAMDDAVETVADFERQMRDLGTAEYRAVATSAVREAKNRDAFIRRVKKEAGIRLEAISGSEEARLVHLAVSKRIPLGSRKWLLVDLGGGSVEVSLVDEHGAYWSESHTMGSVRLLEELTEAGTDPGRFRRLLAEYVSVLRVPALPDDQQVSGYIATGGNIETLAKLGGLPDEEGVIRLPVETLKTLIEQLARLSYHQRVEELGLRDDRADVILPAAMVYERLAELCRASEIIVPNVGIKEGVVYDLASQLTQKRDHEDRQEREILSSAAALGRKYLFDETHARHVTSLAASLFDQLKPLHALDDADRKILLAAAMLSNIGQFVGYKGHHKHSLYLISNSELPNFSQNEMSMVANVARYHRKAHPRPHHHDFVSLSEEDQDRVTKLASILRIADSLDREHTQRVKGVTVKMTDDDVALWLDGTAGVLLEGWSLKKKANLFSEVFDRSVGLRFLGEEQPIEAEEVV
ncbi:MAG: Ppx/GppA family phosphatase [Acidobacteria bacterium]|jgi:exopolyphosphatase/guanosine-5'-triphosphate,3'-diphosphate pyrophosphatase|nr:Ppx/GppA family phosphatase [Acidobacteriota bacterium]